MQRLYSVTVRGKNSEWCWYRHGTPEHAADWRADGLEVVEIVNEGPGWVIGFGLLKPWCWLQDLLSGRSFEEWFYGKR